MSVLTNLDPDKIQDVNNDPLYESRFMIKDGFYKGNIYKAKEIETDREKGEGNPYNWKNIETKSYKKCSLDASTTK